VRDSRVKVKLWGAGAQGERDEGDRKVETLAVALVLHHPWLHALFNVEDGNLRDGPAIIGTGNLELHH